MLLTFICIWLSIEIFHIHLIFIHMDIILRYFIWKQLNFLICIENQHGHQNDLFFNLISFFGWRWQWTMYESSLTNLHSSLLSWLLHEAIYPLHYTFTNQWSPLISITKLLLWALGLVSFIDSLLSVYTPGLDKTQRRTSTINTHQ